MLTSSEDSRSELELAVKRMEGLALRSIEISRHAWDKYLCFNLATRIDGAIATNNQDRQDSNSRLAAIQRQVSAIAKHLGVI